MLEEGMGERCFGSGNPVYETYHDKEWGVPLHDDRHLFEMLILEGAQAGLSWETILNKREGYRAAFYNFEIEKVAAMSDAELEALRSNPAIVRNRLKIYATRKNAQAALTLQQIFGNLDTYLWSFVSHKTIQSAWPYFEMIPTRSTISDALSKDLKKHGMSFVGSTIVYAFMQAVGMVNDHPLSCPRHEVCRRY